MRLVIGRIGRAHGVHGDVFVEPFTDEPDVRFADHEIVESSVSGPLEIAATKWHSGKFLVRFVGINDRSSAEGLRGGELTIEVDPQARPEDPDEYYDHQLVGLTALDPASNVIGMVTDVVHLPGQDLLDITKDSGGTSLVPFVSAIVTDVDLAARTVTIDAPPGLLDDAHAEIAGDADQGSNQ